MFSPEVDQLTGSRWRAPCGYAAQGALIGSVIALFSTLFVEKPVMRWLSGELYAPARRAAALAALLGGGSVGIASVLLMGAESNRKIQDLTQEEMSPCNVPPLVTHWLNESGRGRLYMTLLGCVGSFGLMWVGGSIALSESKVRAGCGAFTTVSIPIFANSVDQNSRDDFLPFLVQRRRQLMRQRPTRRQ